MGRLEIVILLVMDMIGVLASGCMLWLALVPKWYLGEQAEADRMRHRQTRMRAVFLATICLSVFILIGVGLAFPKWLCVLTGLPAR